MAGAGAFAKTLYDDAAYRARFAQENWNSNKESVRNEAHMRAIEATVAAHATEVPPPEGPHSESPSTP